MVVRGLPVVVIVVAAAAIGPDSSRRPELCGNPQDCASAARATALARHHATLNFDSRDIHRLSVILEDLRRRHTRSPLPKEVLEAEARQWGTVYGEMVRSVGFRDACWGVSKEGNRSHPFVLHLDCKGGWEYDVIDMIEKLVTKPRPTTGPAGSGHALTIEQELNLSLEVLWD